MTWFVVILAAAAVLLLVLVVAAYNRLVRLRNRTQNAWSQVDVQLRRRYDLIPNLVETVKGYASHEQQTFEQVTQARTAARQAQGVQEQGQAENVLTAAIGRLFAVAEAYPQLRATENFQQLQAQLSDVEEKISITRRVYNDTVETYNTKIQVFPSVLIANAGGFERREFFEAGAGAEIAPTVSRPGPGAGDPTT